MVRSVGEGPTACQKQTASALLSGSPTLAGARSVHTTQSRAGRPARRGHSTGGTVPCGG